MDAQQTGKTLLEHLIDELEHPTERDAAFIERRILRFLLELFEGHGGGTPDRDAAKQEADRGGWFWLPCLFCGAWHNGREWRDSGFPSFMINSYDGHGICDKPECKAQAERLNREYPNGVCGE